MNFNVRVEYEPLPIRHIAVQCPECKNWFHGMDMKWRKFSPQYFQMFP